MKMPEYIPDCKCGTKLNFIGYILTDYDVEYDVGDLSDISVSTDELFQCPNCKTIKIGIW